MTKIHFVFLNNSYIYTAILQFIFDVQNHRYLVVCDFHSNLSRILLEVIQKTKSGCSCERNVYVAYRSNCTVDIRASYRRARLKPSNVGVHDLKKFHLCFLTDSHSGFPSRRGFKLLDSSTGRWYLFSCRDATDYGRWMEAFSVEKRVVTEDQLNGFNVTSLTKQNSRIQQITEGKWLTLRTFQHILILIVLNSYLLGIGNYCVSAHCVWYDMIVLSTRSSAVAERPRDASRHWIFC